MATSDTLTDTQLLDHLEFLRAAGLLVLVSTTWGMAALTPANPEREPEALMGEPAPGGVKASTVREAIAKHHARVAQWHRVPGHEPPTFDPPPFPPGIPIGPRRG